MRLTTIQLVLAALAPRVLAFTDACRRTWVYCGSSLIQYNGIQFYHEIMHFDYTLPSLLPSRPGYTVSELRSIIGDPNIGLHAFAAFAEPEHALFRCTDDVGELELVEFCFEGCTKPPNGDVCAA